MSIYSAIPKPKQKGFINLVLFLASIAIVVYTGMIESDMTFIEVAGDTIIVSACYLLLYLFILHFRKEILDVSRKILFILAIILAFVIMTKFVITQHQASIIFLVPYALIALVIRSFYDARLAMFILLVTLMLSGFMVTGPFEFIFINLLAGIVAILSLSDINRKYKLIFSSFMVTITYIVIFIALTIRQKGTVSMSELSELKWFIGNGLLLLSGYPIISIFEKKFYFLSDTTMHELSDSNNPLLRRLSEEAPGSYQHSLQVANLAEAASRSIGANVLLSRTGSLYHDIGKITSPEFFIENQKSEGNPHLDLDPEVSSRIIINHVEEGVKLAHDYKIPVQIIDFIKTHHGTKKAYYFYKKYLQKEKTGKLTEVDFQYKGPKPFSREMAIVMMADAVEASSRTLEEYTEETINELVERTVLIQEQEEQFSDAPLTFREITEIKAVFKKRLSNMYHSRIAYP
ncbi:MAG TPA: HDIG domain-containing protein [Bacteroidales bacterium]|nr:HDIG domain-containing protein [Bacteroidales bacterium]